MVTLLLGGDVMTALDPARGELEALRMRPLQVRCMRLARAERRDAEWLADTLNEICEEYGPRFDLAGDGTLRLRGAARPPSRA